MLITDYTTYDEVRSVMGVGAKELPDATIALAVYVEGLRSELLDVSDAVLVPGDGSPDLPAAFATVNAILENARTDDEARLYSAVRLFSPFAVGRLLFSGLPLFAPKEITDGKAGVARFTADPYKVTIQNCEDLYARALTRLQSAFVKYIGKTENVVLRPYFSSSAPSSDQVVGT